MSKIVAILFALMIILSSSAAPASDKTADIIGDALVLRPLGFAMSVVGTTLYVITLPISAISRSTDRTYKALVKHPFEYTFVRPMGEIESGLD